ncbi:DUF1642 domain-containing protein [Enterococcus avium]|uniref:DUF1642 domain-containing protein n=1 Tax=Enterococcus avium TaxID=33945 RepID=UPI00288F4A63|nr:DUF1642 domain-containing protein [Enterococcus avium]MDT2472050.1 DUF1642 domain-containing protein [Enterococcus avium]
MKWTNSSGNHAYQIEKRYEMKQELIKFVRQQQERTDKFDFTDVEDSDRADYLANVMYVNYKNLLDKLEQQDEPQIVKVKPYVAEWFEKNKDDLEFNIWRYIKNWNEHPKDEFQMFMNNGPSKPIETLIRMQDGYEVEEEPKRWVVRQGGSEVWYLQGFRNSLDGDIVKQWCNHEGCIKFTDKSKAEAVATLVEGSMEEV